MYAISFYIKGNFKHELIWAFNFIIKITNNITKKIIKLNLFIDTYIKGENWKNARIICRWNW